MRGDFAAARAASGRNERALAIGASRKFALQSVTMEVTASPRPSKNKALLAAPAQCITLCYRLPQVDAALRPSVIDFNAHAPMPLMEGQPFWHAQTMRRVASHALNLTGASLHPAYGCWAKCCPGLTSYRPRARPPQLGSAPRPPPRQLAPAWARDEVMPRRLHPPGAARPSGSCAAS